MVDRIASRNNTPQELILKNIADDNKSFNSIGGATALKLLDTLMIKRIQIGLKLSWKNH